jgi:hypothetical protein
MPGSSHEDDFDHQSPRKRSHSVGEYCGKSTYGDHKDLEFG